MTFLLIPIAAWITCGAVKFGFNVVQYGYQAVHRIGHGGFPSNHTAIISSMMWTLALAGQWDTAGLALAVLMIYAFDATGLRREIGRHAISINQLTGSRLREILGHTALDIAGGLLVGFAVAYTFNSLGQIT